MSEVEKEVQRLLDQLDWEAVAETEVKEEEPPDEDLVSLLSKMNIN
jgi:hypothetical protein